LYETFLNIRINESDIDINVHVAMSAFKVPPNSCQILIILEFSRQILEKFSNTKFHENPFGVKLCCSMRTEIEADRHDKAAFQNFAKTPKICFA
jgi:hypothetical protein